MKYFELSICASFTCLPSRKIQNHELELELQSLNSNKICIEKFTGIKERRYAQPHESSSDLAVKAIQVFLDKNESKKENISTLIVASTSPDCPSPATANWVHKGLNLNSNVHCFDIASSCSSFLSAMKVACGVANSQEDVILISTEVKHKSLAQNDARTRALFADGASGVYLSKINSNSKIKFVYTFIDSQLVNHICIPVGGSKIPCTSENLHENKLRILEPKKIYSLTVNAIYKAIISCIKYSDKELKIGFIFIHQANKNILKDVIKKLPVELHDSIPIMLSDVGNLVCTSFSTLRSRFLFLLSIFKNLENINSSSDILDFLNENFDSYIIHKNKGLVFTSKWCEEEIFILDENCSSLSDSWIARISTEEFERLISIFKKFNTNKSKTMYDIWVVAGGGFQTLGAIHEYKL